MNFYQRLLKINDEYALVKSFLALCKNTKFLNYYNILHGHNKRDNIHDREQRIMTSTVSMLFYYNSLTDVKKKCIIYNSFMDDYKRGLISRWRLSNHKLYIEQVDIVFHLFLELNVSVSGVMFWRTNIMRSIFVLPSIIFVRTSCIY